MQIWNVLHAARSKYRMQKWHKKIAICAPSHNFVGLYLNNWQFEKNLLSSNTSSTCSHNMANFSPLTAEIGSVVCGTPANFNGFRFLAALLHGTLVVGISQTLRRWTEGATYIYSAVRPLRWALAHILVLLYFNANTVNAYPNCPHARFVLSSWFFVVRCLVAYCVMLHRKWCSMLCGTMQHCTASYGKVSDLNTQLIECVWLLLCHAVLHCITSGVDVDEP